MTDQEIEDMWIYRPSIHGDDLMSQLKDFARGIEAKTLERAAAECDRVANRAESFSLVPQQDCASSLATKIREMKHTE